MEIESHMPKHVAIIMDGNGRWASARHLPRFEGHRRGVASVRSAVSFCLKKSIPILTLFAFGTDNWKRPPLEVSFLFELFITSLKKEIANLERQGVCLRFIGDIASLEENLQVLISEAEERTQGGKALLLHIALNYSGRWDMVQASQKAARLVLENKLAPCDINESLLGRLRALYPAPEPELLIRTSGEYRVSNFLLWDLTYTEFYFTPIYWPDFREEAFEAALEAFFHRNRRFGKTQEQIEGQINA